MRHGARAGGDERGHAASQALETASGIYSGDDEDYYSVLHRGGSHRGLEGI